MSTSVDKSSGSQSLLTGQNIVYAGIAWAVVSLLFFLLFSVTAPGEDSPFWYLIGTYILECLPFLAAALLCFRNWRSPQIASGRNVWLGIGLGMTLYFVANLIFGVWELYFGLDPDVSPADLFYLISYILIGWGMVLAVLPRRLNLEKKQWAIVSVIGVLGIVFAFWVWVLAPPVAAEADPVAVALAPSEQAASTAPLPQAAVASQTPLVAASPAVKEKTTVTVTDESLENLPGWVVGLDQFLSPLSRQVNFAYIFFDVVLLIIASTLLLAFWGGRFAQSWRMIAAATFSLYIADMGFKYVDALAKARAQEYESGGLLDIFFVFSAVLFAIGAALEYDVSSRSRRSPRRRP
ncbi:MULTISPECIES: hypothetical protein [unclassified Coleofasciculus]|uniref:hypothetical protein n=1 Tax=unclassified Coleofasciculus TaxID=2692782 RepID=UPI0018806071|nr:MULTISPECIES: hypothetical protein [unclassified Coleofasciculus]MBE9128157.1 hypothetical protein [Coleofasciculus sp. LEGE 07081]MBE9151248.1 hypothetical protein [Coleofasciculus sp. LEGE 07092]